MKKIVYGTMALALFFFSAHALAQENIPETTQRYVVDEVIVKFKPEINLKQSSGIKSMQNFAVNQQLSSESTIPAQNISVMKITDGQSVMSVIQNIQNNSSVEYVQPNFIYTMMMADPNDTDFTDQRGLKNIGQNLGGIGTVGSDIQWNDAMDIWSGNSNQNTTGTIVAVIDVGLRYTHPEFTGQLWNGTNCLSYSGTTLGNCTYGYDTLDKDKDPLPFGTDNHGTHIAGIIGAKTNNGVGIAGINPGAKIMAIRAGTENTGLTTADIIDAINFAKYNGAKIINASRGSVDATCQNAWIWDQGMYESIKNFSGLFITAAGNGTGNIGQQHLNNRYVTPADYNTNTSCRSGLNNIITVAASTNIDTKATFSDYGSNINIAAPGENIWSTILSNSYGRKDGTSMATPFVAAVASLARSMRPDLSYLDIKNAIINQAESISALSGYVAGSKRLNAYTTLLSLDNIKPTATILYSSTGWTTGSIIATITGFSESITGLNAGNHIFTGNGSFEFTFSDLVGNTGSAIATVTWIVCNGVTEIPVTECQALVAFYNSTDGNNWILGTNNVTGATWVDTSHICSGGTIGTGGWYGVSCYNNHVTSIDLRDSNLSGYIPYEIGNLSNLGSLYLPNNHITSLGTGFGNLTRLSVIDLSGNYLSSLPTDFGNLTGLGELYLQGNQLTNLPSNFINLNILYRLHLNNNLLTSLPSGFGNMNGLRVLYLSHNLLTLLPSGFGNLPHLQNLYLDYNHLTSLPNGFGDLLVSKGGFFVGDLNLDNNRFSLTPEELRLYSKIENFHYNDQLLVENLVGTTNVTGSAVLSGATTGGVIFTTSGILNINSLIDSKNVLQLNLSGLSIVASGSTWNKIILAPINLNTGDADYANFGETGIPIQTGSGIKRTILGTILVGSEVDSLIASGGDFTINYYISGGNSGDIIQLYRSNDGNSRIQNMPDTGCVLNSGLICAFNTNHLSYFSPIKETESIVPILSGISSVSNTTTQNPTYSFISNEVGTIIYSGSCSSTTTNAISGTNTITFNTLSNGTYSICKIGVTDQNNNTSDWLTLPTFTINYTAPSGGGGGGGGGTTTPTCTTPQLICTGGVYTIKAGVSCEGGDANKSCTISTGTVLSGKVLSGTIPKYTIFTSNNGGFSAELVQAYNYAHEIGITTTTTIQQANMTGTLIRKHLAKMISNFAIKQMSRVPNTGMKCNFTDMDTENTEMRFYSKLACQLGLMGLDANGKQVSTFSPNDEVTRAQFGTVLSRTLRGNQYNGGEPFYINHLAALQKAVIMKQIDTPENKELRGYVMLMLMRSVE